MRYWRWGVVAAVQIIALVMIYELGWRHGDHWQAQRGAASVALAHYLHLVEHDDDPIRCQGRAADWGLRALRGLALQREHVASLGLWQAWEYEAMEGDFDSRYRIAEMAEAFIAARHAAHAQRRDERQTSSGGQ